MRGEQYGRDVAYLFLFRGCGFFTTHRSNFLWECWSRVYYSRFSGGIVSQASLYHLL